MSKNYRARLIIATTAIAVIAGGAAANAVVFASADAPLTLRSSGTELAQARGSVSDSSSNKFSYTAGYQRDRLNNGDGVYTRIDTDYEALTYSTANGRLIGAFKYWDQQRVRTEATSSAAWTRQTDQSPSIVKVPAYQKLSQVEYVVDVRICEDRGILRPDVCATKTITLRDN